jgi:hypothetical protein
VGALRLLAESYTPQEINQKAWALYGDFRPPLNGWGKRSTITCESILSLRKKPSSTSALPIGDPPGPQEAEDIIRYTADSGDLEDQPERKRLKVKSASSRNFDDDIEAALNDPSFPDDLPDDVS